MPRDRQASLIRNSLTEFESRAHSFSRARSSQGMGKRDHPSTMPTQMSTLSK